MDTWFTSSLILTCIPILAAIVGLIFWNKAHIYKVWALTFLTVTGLVLANYFGSFFRDPDSAILMALIILTAFLTVLGQNHQQKNDASVVMFLTLMLVGLGLGFLSSEDNSRILYLVLVFMLVSMEPLYFKKRSREITVMVGFYGSAILFLAISAVVSEAMVFMFLLVIAVAVIFPLFPLHKGFVATLSYMPGSLPAFLVVLLPSLGFSELAVLIHTLPAWLIFCVHVLALFSILYGVLKSIAQICIRDFLTYTYIIQAGFIWWYLAIIKDVTPQATIYFSAVALSISGLFLACHYLENRLCHSDIERTSGLAHSMPRFATIFMLLITAVTGIPLFAVFFGFFEMILHVSSIFIWGIFVILIYWLMLSWLFPRFMHQILFGRILIPTSSHRDLFFNETLSLVLILLALVFVGLIPFDPSESINLQIQSFQAEKF